MTVSAPRTYERHWNADENRWDDVKAIIGDRRITLGPTASQQWLEAPDHLAMVLARYRAAAALIGDAESVLEVGCGEGIGARILAQGRRYAGIDTDADAIGHAWRTVARCPMVFEKLDVFHVEMMHDDPLGRMADAVVSLDVIEHIPTNREDDFMAVVVGMLRMSPHGVCVIGTPNAAFDHLASPQSKAGHVNLYTHERLDALMSRYFHVVQSFGMQDTSLHLGHPDARHYLLMAGIGPRRG